MQIKRRTALSSQTINSNHREGGRRIKEMKTEVDR